jgi:hypothetical protein
VNEWVRIRMRRFVNMEAVLMYSASIPMILPR